MVYVPIILEVLARNSGAINGIARDFQQLQQKAEDAKKGTSGLKDETERLNAVYEKARSKDLDSKNKFDLTNQKNANALFVLGEKQKQAESQVSLSKDILAEKLRQASLNGTASSFQAVQRAQIALSNAQARHAAIQNSYNLKQREAFDFNLKGIIGLKNEVNGLVPALSNAGSASEGALGASGILGGINGATLATGALTAAVGVGLIAAFKLASDAASAFFSQITRQFEEASKAQLAGFGSSREFQKIYNLDQTQADKAYRDLRERTEIAGRDTSVSTEEIQQLTAIGATPLSKTLAKSGATPEQANDTIIDISKRYAILAQTTKGVTPFQVQSAFTSAISGDLYDASSRQEVFRNSGLKANLEDAAKELGINFKKATQEEQVRILQRGLQLRVDDSLIKRTADDSVQSQISKVYDTLFGLTKGIFGIERDLDTSTDGVQSVFSEFTQTVKLTLGEGGLFDELGKSLAGAFPGFDPMVALRDAFTQLNEGIKGLTQFIKDINAEIKSFLDSPIGKAIMSIDKAIGSPGQTLIGTNNPNIVQGANKVLGFGAPTTQIGGSIDVKPLLNSFVFAPTNALFDTIFGTKAPNAKPSADGFMPVQSAIDFEMKRKPTGSQLLVANSSETILTQKQTEEILKPVNVPVSVSSPTVVNHNTNQPIHKTVQIGSIVMPTTTTTDPQTLAQYVINQIEQAFNSEMEANLG